LLREAIGLIGGTAGLVTAGTRKQRALIPVGTGQSGLEHARLRLGEGASWSGGGAARAGARAELGRGRDRASAGDGRLRSAVAVPLLHESRLVGTIAIGTDDVRKTFTQQDTELSSCWRQTAAAALVALEHARLDGVLLAARTAQHELNNQLAVARGYAEMLAGAPDLPPHLLEYAEEVKNAADDAAETVRQLRNISRIHEHHWSDAGDTTSPGRVHAWPSLSWHETCLIADHRGGRA